MTDISPFDAIPEEAVAPIPARPRVLLTGTVLAAAAVAIAYAGLVGHYAARRSEVRAGGETWLPDGVVIPLTQPNYMMFTMVLSIISILWAVHAVKLNDRTNAYSAFGLTLVFGVSQIFQTYFLVSILDMAPETEQATLIYTLIGVQIAVLGAAMAFVAAAAIRTMIGGYSSRDYEGVAAAAIFWILAVGVYTALWYAVYITK